MERRKFIIKSTILSAASLAGTTILSSRPPKTSVIGSMPSGAFIEMRLAAYNVLFGNWGTPKRIGEMFKLDTFRFMMKRDDTYSLFYLNIRKRLNLTPDETLYIYINNKLPGYIEKMGVLFDKYKSTDNMLRVYVSQKPVSKYKCCIL